MPVGSFVWLQLMVATVCCTGRTAEARARRKPRMPVRVAAMAMRRRVRRDAGLMSLPLVVLSPVVVASWGAGVASWGVGVLVVTLLA